MTRRERISWVAGAGLVAALAVPALAGGVPTSSAPPTIDGYPGYNSLLTCKQGSWSPDAQSFEYSWHYAARSEPVLATTQTYRPEAPLVGNTIECTVTAKDAQGGAASVTSAAVAIGQGRTSMKLRAKPVQHRKVTLKGRAGPLLALKGGSGRTAGVVAYRRSKIGLVQLFGKQSLDTKTGKFKIVAPDTPGKHTYQVNFNPAEPSLWKFSNRTVKVKLKKR
jgi:hypothetical protein